MSIQSNLMPDNLIRAIKNTPLVTNNLPKGEVIFYQGGGFTVIGISGSCKDDRPGTKSIFWVEELLTFNDMKNRILDYPIAKYIFGSMPFKIQWTAKKTKQP